MTSARITLTIRETRTVSRPTYCFSISVDGQAVVHEQRLNVPEAAALQSLHNQYQSLFSRGAGPSATVLAQERALGVALFNLWLGSSWRRVEALVQHSPRRILEIDAEPAQLYDLPWTLLRPPTRDFLTIDPTFSICYTQRAQFLRTQPLTAVPNGPLRLLVMVCAPIRSDSGTLFQTEASLLSAIGCVDTPMEVDVAEIGSIAEFHDRLRSFQPQMLHLICDIRIGRPCPGCGDICAGYRPHCPACRTVLSAAPSLPYLAFEQPGGGLAWFSAADLRDVLADSPCIRAVYVNPLQRDTAPPLAAMGQVCRMLVTSSTPLVIGWPQTIETLKATRFVKDVYQRIAAGGDLGAALATAQSMACESIKHRATFPWPAPGLYTATSYTRVTEQPTSKASALTAVHGRLQPLVGISAGGATCFVGRRREVQDLLPPLQRGSLHTLVLCGGSGVGKSVLATSLARSMARESMMILPISTTPHTRLSIGRFLFTAAAALHNAAPIAARTLFDSKRSISDRIEHVLGLLDEHRIMLVLDRFDLNLDTDTGRIRDPWLAALCAELLYRPGNNRRIIMTSRVPPIDLGVTPTTTRVYDLQPLSEGAFLAYLARDRDISRGMVTEKLSTALLSDAYSLLWEMPHLTEQLRAAIRDLSAESIQALVTRLRQQTQKQVFDTTSNVSEVFDTLYGTLGQGAQQSLRRLAVFDIPVHLNTLATTNVPPQRLLDDARTWYRSALAMPVGNGAWTVAEVLRDWLMLPTRCSPEERHDAHRSAGDWLTQTLSSGNTTRLRISQLDAWLEARAQYISATAADQAHRVTERIARTLDRWGLADDGLMLQHDLRLLDHPTPV